MNSALVVTPYGNEDRTYVREWCNFLIEVRFLSNILDQTCKILLQHSLVKDNLTIMVEMGAKTFSGTGSKFQEATALIIKEMQDHRREHEKLLAKTQQAARKEGRKRRGGNSSGGKRLKPVRQG